MLFPCCVVCQSNFSPAPETLPFFVGISSFFFYYVYSPHVGKLWQQAIPTSYLATTTPSSTGGYIALPRTSLPLHHQLTAHIRSTEYYIHRFSYGVHTILSLEPRAVRSSHPRCLICNTTPPPLAPTTYSDLHTNPSRAASGKPREPWRKPAASLHSSTGHFLQLGRRRKKERAAGLVKQGRQQTFKGIWRL